MWKFCVPHNSIGPNLRESCTCTSYLYLCIIFCTNPDLCVTKHKYFIPWVLTFSDSNYYNVMKTQICKYEMFNDLCGNLVYQVHHWKKIRAKKAPPWSRFGKRCHFEGWNRGTKTVPKRGPSCGHENGSTVELFRLHFFLSVMYKIFLSLYCILYKCWSLCN